MTGARAETPDEPEQQETLLGGNECPTASCPSLEQAQINRGAEGGKARGAPHGGVLDGTAIASHLVRQIRSGYAQSLEQPRTTRVAPHLRRRGTSAPRKEAIGDIADECSSPPVHAVATTAHGIQSRAGKAYVAATNILRNIPAADLPAVQCHLFAREVAVCHFLPVEMEPSHSCNASAQALTIYPRSLHGLSRLGLVLGGKVGVARVGFTPVAPNSSAALLLMEGSAGRRRVSRFLGLLSKSANEALLDATRASSLRIVQSVLGLGWLCPSCPASPGGALLVAACWLLANGSCRDVGHSSLARGASRLGSPCPVGTCFHRAIHAARTVMGPGLRRYHGLAINGTTPFDVPVIVKRFQEALLSGPGVNWKTNPVERTRGRRGNVKENCPCIQRRYMTMQLVAESPQGTRRAVGDQPRHALAKRPNVQQAGGMEGPGKCAALACNP